MKKVSIIMLNRDKLEALTKLRKLGLVHLETVTGNSEKLSSLKEAQANAIQALSVLSEIKVKKSKKNVPTLNEDEAKKKCAEIVGLVSEKKSLLERISQDYLELDRFASWGKIDPKDFEYLTSKGINLSLYEIPGDKYQNIPESVQTILVGKGKKSTRFLLLASDENAKESLPQEAFEVTLPAKSSDGFVEEIKNDKARIVKIDEELAQNVCYISSIKELQKSLDKEVEFENVYSGMNVTDDGKETDLAWISGFIPGDGLASLQELAKENNWAITSGDIETEDDPPTKLKNNKLVSLIYPLTDFLGTVPGYREFDISGWFLLFFAIFFGMIFGDAGYGLIMFVAALILIIKSKAQGKSSPMLGLLVLLSLSTVAWGTITCTWFGLSVDQIPDVLKNLSLPPLSSAFKDRYDGVQSLLTTDQNLQ
ncbi:MAG: ATPase, partial [Treponema sp.]|nr:ATPase [Treponema sp.]